MCRSGRRGAARDGGIARPRSIQGARRRTGGRAWPRDRARRGRGRARGRRPRLEAAVDRALTPLPDVPWVPAQVRWTAAGPVVDWCHLGDLRFIAPFFEQTIDDAMAHPFNLLFARSTPLADIAHHEPELRPAGLIFHMSRCGSTLVSRMLAALPRNVVLSEP